MRSEWDLRGCDLDRLMRAFRSLAVASPQPTPAIPTMSELSSYEQRFLLEAETGKKNADNALALQSAEAKHALAIQAVKATEAAAVHERSVVNIRAGQIFELEKLGTLDASKESQRDHELQKLALDCQLARTGGMVRGFSVGMLVGAFGGVGIGVVLGALSL